MQLVRKLWAPDTTWCAHPPAPPIVCNSWPFTRRLSAQVIKALKPSYVSSQPG